MGKKREQHSDYIDCANSRCGTPARRTQIIIHMAKKYDGEDLSLVHHVHNAKFHLDSFWCSECGHYTVRHAYSEPMQ